MILRSTVAEKLRSLMSQIPSWRDLAGSQFLNQLSVFMGWAVEDAAFKVERAHQEGFIDTALNRSSILAHGEGREYLPRKPIPATGKVSITNQGEVSVTLLREREFMSDTQTLYTLDETVTIAPLDSIEAHVTQRGKTSLTFTIDEYRAFYELLLGRDLSPRIADLRVWLDEGEGFVEWTYNRLLTNAYPDTLAYDEFYHHTDQIGIRFGTGSFGKIPSLGAKVRVDVTTTDGDTTLLEKQTLWPTEEIILKNGHAAQLQIVVSQTIQNGESQEGTEEMRRNLHYAPVYNNRLVWDNDYSYFLRRRYPEIVFVKAWGEEEAEKMWGYNLNHINRIWICAYCPAWDIQNDAMKAIQEVPFLCRNFQWYPPEHLEFTLNITGKTLQDCVLSEVVEAIQQVLLAAYGKDSRSRRDSILLHEIYQAIYSTGFFDKETGAWFTVETVGVPTDLLIYQMVSIDIEKTQIDISYL